MLAEWVAESLWCSTNSTKRLAHRRNRDLHFKPGGRAAFQHRDIGMALEAARGRRVPLPVTAVVDQLCAALVAVGGGELDHSALITVLERLAARG